MSPSPTSKKRKAAAAAVTTSTSTGSTTTTTTTTTPVVTTAIPHTSSSVGCQSRDKTTTTATSKDNTAMILPSSSASAIKKKMPSTLSVSNKTTTTMLFKKKKSTTNLPDAVIYTPLSLADIQERFKDLCLRIPNIPDSGFLIMSNNNNHNHDIPMHDKKGPTLESSSSCTTRTDQDHDPDDPSLALPRSTHTSPYNKDEIREWATLMQSVLDEFNLLIACVSPATYVWGSDRSGASEQNLSMLSSELIRSQEQIMARVAPRINDVLAPTVSLVTDKTITTKIGTTKEIKQNYFKVTQDDPDYVNLCHTIVARNAALLRQVVLANLDKILKAIQDFLAAQHADSQHNARGLIY